MHSLWCDQYLEEEKQCNEVRVSGTLNEQRLQLPHTERLHVLAPRDAIQDADNVWPVTTVNAGTL